MNFDQLLEVNKYNKNFEIWKLKNPKLFWQYPVITEQQAYNSLLKIAKLYVLNEHYVYLAIPWVTIIDQMNHKIADAVRISEIVDIIKKYTTHCKLNNNTIFLTSCQSIHYKKLFGYFKELKIKYLFTPHKIQDIDQIEGIQIKAFPLYAVNFENKNRSNGLKYTANRKYLYSFIGAYQSTNYLSQIRLNLTKLNNSDGIIKIRKEWYFNNVVYNEQIRGKNNASSQNTIDKDTIEYNQILSQSRYSLCPSGSGPNSIRLWESLAVGSIPVILSDNLELPSSVIDWNQVLIKINEKNYQDIPLILSKISKKREEEMRYNCIRVYDYFARNNFSRCIFDSLVKIEQTNNLFKNPSTLKNYTLVHYCCSKYPTSFGGVARFDYHVSIAFPRRLWFQGPDEKQKLLNYIAINNHKTNLIILVDNHLACDIPNELPVIVFHHGCCRRTLENTPELKKDQYYSMLLNMQDNITKYRKPHNTLMLSCSQCCIDDFSHYYNESYRKFPIKLLLHSSELEYNGSIKTTNIKPVILGNWNHPKKGGELIEKLKNELKNEFEFQTLVTTQTNDIWKHNNQIKKIYQNADIFLHLSRSEGFAYATCDGFNQNLLIVGTNTGLLYDLKQKNEDVGVIFDVSKMNDTKYVADQIRSVWDKREHYHNKSRKWFETHCNFMDWVKNFRSIIDQQYCLMYPNDQPVNVKRYGTQYGGFYWYNSMNLDSKSVVYCVGVGEDISHDVEISHAYKCKIYLFDPTPRAIQHVEIVKNTMKNGCKPSTNTNVGGNDHSYWDHILKHSVNGDLVSLHQYGLYTSDTRVKFYKPKNKEHVSCSLNNKMKNVDIGDYYEVEVKTLDTIMKTLHHDHIDLLKIDIEGIECEVIKYMIDHKIYPKYLGVDFATARLVDGGKKLVDDTIQQLHNNGYMIIRNNNYYITFVKII